MQVDYITGGVSKYQMKAYLLVIKDGERGVVINKSTRVFMNKIDAIKEENVINDLQDEWFAYVQKIELIE